MSRSSSVFRFDVNPNDTNDKSCVCLKASSDDSLDHLPALAATQSAMYFVARSAQNDTARDVANAVFGLPDFVKTNGDRLPFASYPMGGTSVSGTSQRFPAIAS